MALTPKLHVITIANAHRNCLEVQQGMASHENRDTTNRSIRVLALMEACTVTGPAKNLIRFAEAARTPILQQCRAEVAITTYERGSPGRPSPFQQAVLAAKLPLHVLVERHRFDRGIIAQLRSLVNTVNPNLLQSHNVKSHFIIRLANLHRYHPWIAFHHGYTSTDLKDRLYNQINRWSLRAADHVITVCGPFAEHIKELGVPSSRISIIHNIAQPFHAVSPREALVLRTQIGCVQGDLLVLTVGRLSQEKGHVDLLNAAALVKQTHPALRFRIVVVGSGPERERLVKVARACRVDQLLYLAGHQERLEPYYSAADLLVIPSHSEGSPNVLLEAMTAGIPIVTTNAGGIPEIITHRHDALLVPVRNVRALAASIIELAEDRQLAEQLARAAYVSARKYTCGAYQYKIIDTYTHVLSARV